MTKKDSKSNTPFYSSNYVYQSNLYEDDYNEQINLFDDKCEPDARHIRTSSKDFLDPYRIYQALSRHIFKQDKYLKDLSMFFYNHCRGIRQTMLVTGPSGCGKTEAIRSLQSMTQVEIKICDGSLVSKQSYRGDYKVTDLVKTDSDRAIVVIDEFDKLVMPTYGNSSVPLQSELLKIVEGGQVNLRGDSGEKYNIDTSRMSFILIGSFQELEQKICKDNSSSGLGFNAFAKEQKPFESTLTIEQIIKEGGLIPELAGRINIVSNVEPFDISDYEKILFDKTTSPLVKLEKQFDAKLRISTEQLKLIADEAYEQSLGIRGISSKLIALLNEQIFRDFEEKQIQKPSGALL